MEGGIVMANTVKLQGIHGEQKGMPTKNLKIGYICRYCDSLPEYC